MSHADSAFVPEGLTKSQFWEHVHDQLVALLEGQRSWVVNLANAASILYNALLASPDFGDGQNAVNWCGFYINTRFHPEPRLKRSGASDADSTHLLLGPFCGKPACQLINTAPGKARGVCADAYIQRKTIVVADVEAYPGHIACDGETRSEIVCPLIVQTPTESVTVGVLDLDCLALSGFAEEDKRGLERIARTLADACDW